MNVLAAGGKATLAGRRTAEANVRLLGDELPRVRTAALAWLNGLAALLAGLIGFSLIKGRSDITQLARPWDVVVGVLLLVALISGARGALQLLWAAHGRPTPIRRATSRGRASEHAEAVASAHALSSGIRLALGCAAFLVAAVGFTWYGPERGKPVLEIRTPAGTVCGEVVTINSGSLTLKTDAGESTVDLRAATGVRAIEKCPSG